MRPVRGTFWMGCAVTAVLSGCMGGGEGAASRGASDPAAPVLGQAEASRSVVIADLLRRRSVIAPESAFGRVADAVLAANTRAAEAELRAARLRSVAAEKNWLPTIGPSVSLSSLGDLVTSIIVDQVIWQGGRKKAERAYAAADVEHAAVVLAEDTNARVLTALSLYLAAEQGRAEAGVAAKGLERMKHFEWVMEKRVAGGVSDLSELSVMRQKRAEVEAAMRAGTEAAATALAELNAMSVRPLQEVRGLGEARVPGGAQKALGVLRAEADKARRVAEARVERAGYLPGVSAQANLGDGGGDPGLRVGAENGLGFGTGARLQAIKAAEAGAEARLGQAKEESARRLAGLRQELAAGERQAAEQGQLAGQARRNYEIFQQQYDGGQRKVLEVVNTFETWLDAETKRVALTHRAALTRLKIAAELGLLVDGSRI
ncbi:TolC family protein [Oceanicola sp. 502str15]|uniref:TolC family protein n=1 Tax=Oceanicola sp. 502str15 TaxID=2696061 RepID=UPI0020954EA2|nr:TolC family protein [Oceanicola sp. 502str15]MCO6381436.1 TolC family protein [Oceanicola sp. 502str15]